MFSQYAMFGKFVHEDFIDIKSSVLTWQCFHCRLHEHHLVLFLDERVSTFHKRKYLNCTNSAPRINIQLSLLI
jgi:hypothetical protein